MSRLRFKELSSTDPEGNEIQLEPKVTRDVDTLLYNEWTLVLLYKKQLSFDDLEDMTRDMWLIIKLLGVFNSRKTQLEIYISMIVENKRIFLGYLCSCERNMSLEERLIAIVLAASTNTRSAMNKALTGFKSDISEELSLQDVVISQVLTKYRIQEHWSVDILSELYPMLTTMYNLRYLKSVRQDFWTMIRVDIILSSQMWRAVKEDYENRPHCRVIIREIVKSLLQAIKRDADIKKVITILKDYESGNDFRKRSFRRWSEWRCFLPESYILASSRLVDLALRLDREFMTEANEGKLDADDLFDRVCSLRRLGSSSDATADHLITESIEPKREAWATSFEANKKGESPAEDWPIDDFTEGAREAIQS